MHDIAKSQGTRSFNHEIVMELKHKFNVIDVRVYYLEAM